MSLKLPPLPEPVGHIIMSEFRAGRANYCRAEDLLAYRAALLRAVADWCDSQVDQGAEGIFDTYAHIADELRAAAENSNV